MKSVVSSHPHSSDGIKDLLLCLKALLTSNFPAACMALGGTVLSLGYQRIVHTWGSCPVVLLTGDTETSKTTVLRACLSLTGTSDVKGLYISFFIFRGRVDSTNKPILI